MQRKLINLINFRKGIHNPNNIPAPQGSLILYTVAQVIGAVLANFIPEPLVEEPLEHVQD